MNAAHLHLIVNHLPLFAALFAIPLLGVGLLRSVSSLRTVGLALAVVAGAGGVLAQQSGERAEDIVEEIAGIDEAALESHEDSAELTAWALGALGFVSLLGLVVPESRQRVRTAVGLIALLLALVAFGMTAVTANLGGRIRHTEIGMQDTVPTSLLHQQNRALGQDGHLVAEGGPTHARVLGVHPV